MRNKKLWPLIIGVTILMMVAVMAAVPQLFSTYGRKEMFEPWMGLSAEHILGTNSLGYDVFTELVYAARDTIIVGLLSSALTMLLSVLIGVLSSSKGLVGGLFTSLTNVFVMLPKTVCLIVLSTFIGGGRLSLALLIAVFSWSQNAKAIAAKANHVKEQDYIEALRIQGYSKLHISLHHILPNISDVILSRTLLAINHCIMMESTLSFLGLGDSYYPTWGSMINFAYNRGAFIRGAYAYILSPGICIMLLCLAFYLIASYIESRKGIINN